MAETGTLYRECRERIVDLTSALADVDAATPVPSCPGWTVHDVVAHLCGVVDDALHGRMEGAPSPAWTAKQVEARKGASLSQVLDEWTGMAPRFEALPLPFQAVADIATHEQDLRGALRVPGFRDNAAITFVVPILLDGLGERVARHHLPPLVIDCGDQAVLTGTGDGAGESGGDGGDGPVRLTTTPFEVFRASFGRRSRDQVLAMAWTGDGTPYLDALFIFDPSELDLVE